MGTAYDGQDSYFCNGFRSTDLYTVINNKMHSFEKKSRLHIALCALSLLAACASDPIGEEAPQPVGEPSRETAATGRLRVKFQTGRGSGADHRDPQRAANGFRAVGSRHRGARRHADAARLPAGGPLRGAHAPCRTGSLVRRLVRFAAFRDAGDARSVAARRDRVRRAGLCDPEYRARAGRRGSVACRDENRLAAVRRSGACEAMALFQRRIDARCRRPEPTSICFGRGR